jgi:hypothetical protein
MGNLFTVEVGNIFTVPMGNVLTERVGKVLVFYSSLSVCHLTVSGQGLGPGIIKNPWAVVGQVSQASGLLDRGSNRGNIGLILEGQNDKPSWSTMNRRQISGLVRRRAR